MSRIIEDYYTRAKISPTLLAQKMSKLRRNEDILKEFEYWIEHKAFTSSGISVEGYTAQSLSALSAYVDGEAAFMLLVELREAPNRAHNRIKNGFKVK